MQAGAAAGRDRARERDAALRQLGRGAGPVVHGRHREIVALLGRTGAGKSTAMNLIMGTIERQQRHRPRRRLRSLSRSSIACAASSRSASRPTGCCRGARRSRTSSSGCRFSRVDKADGRRRATRMARPRQDGRRGRQVCRTNSQAACASAYRLRARSRSIRKSCCSMNCSASSTMSRRRRCARDVSDLVRTLGKTCLLITHRIDDALEMADRILVLASPARVILEVRPTAAERSAIRRALKALHDKIAVRHGRRRDNRLTERMRSGPCCALPTTNC